MKTVSSALIAGSLLLSATPAVLAETDASRDFTFYVQQAWPKQTTANDQIGQINQIFGTDFDDWGEVPNLSIGAQLFWRVAPQWKLGLQVDYGAGSLEGSAHVPTEAGSAKLSFEQKYDIYIDFYAVAKFFPWPDLKDMHPFLYAGAGMAYESDTTTLKLQNPYIDAGLRVENSGWFPTYTAGLGIDLPINEKSPWYLEFGVAYVWSRMTNTVDATGSLAPSPRVTADTDLTGPNYWLGVGRSF